MSSWEFFPVALSLVPHRPQKILESGPPARQCDMDRIWEQGVTLQDSERAGGVPLQENSEAAGKKIAGCHPRKESRKPQREKKRKLQGVMPGRSLGSRRRDVLSYATAAMIR